MGLCGADASVGFAAEELENTKASILSIEGRSVWAKRRLDLVRSVLPVALIFFLIGIGISLKSGDLDWACYSYFLGGAMAGLCLSYLARKKKTFEELFETDWLHPLLRMLFVALAASLILALCLFGVMEMKIAEVSTWISLKTGESQL